MGHVDCMKYLYENGFKFNRDSFSYSLKSNKTEIYDYIYENYIAKLMDDKLALNKLGEDILSYHNYLIDLCSQRYCLYGLKLFFNNGIRIKEEQIISSIFCEYGPLEREYVLFCYANKLFTSKKWLTKTKLFLRPLFKLRNEIFKSRKSSNSYFNLICKDIVGIIAYYTIPHFKNRRINPNKIYLPK